MLSKPALRTPTSNHGGVSRPLKTANPQTSAAIALTMGWQLLVVVVAPLLVGQYLDSRSGHGLGWTVAGMVVAMIGLVAVIIRTMRDLNQVNGTGQDK